MTGDPQLAREIRSLLWHGGTTLGLLALAVRWPPTLGAALLAGLLALGLTLTTARDRLGIAAARRFLVLALAGLPLLGAGLAAAPLLLALDLSRAGTVAAVTAPPPPREMIMLRQKSLMLVLVKAVGLWLVAASLGGLVTTLTTIGYWVLESSNMGGLAGQQWWSLVGLVSPLVQAAVGLYLFLGGRWVVNLAIPGNRRYCPHCGYQIDERAAAPTECAECGGTLPRTEADPAEDLAT